MRLRFLIEYDGTDFVGWQRQPTGPSVQGTLEDVLNVALGSSRLGTEVGLMGSGRTDAGVHARGQVAHADVPDGTDPYRLRGHLNGLLPPSIAMIDVEEAPPTFHARFDARRRTYHYHVATSPRALDRTSRVALRQPTDMGAMNHATEAVLGTHEFSSFCRTRSGTINRVCTVEAARWVPEERPGDWHFEIVATRFLHGMVRALVGTLLEVGRGRRAPSDLSRVLAQHDRRAAGPAAPAHGLVLHRVDYSTPVFLGHPRTRVETATEA
ncbi:MAG: tRNA pseudouridine(38-40) synthase TruA, partial [Bacteroidota bacterium]